MKFFFGLLIVSSSLLLGYFAPMQESAIAQQTCPNIRGFWKRADGIIWNYTQKGCTLTARVTNTPTYIDTISGVLFDNRTADVVISHTYVPTGCQTKMYSTLTVLSVPNLIRISVYATDGKCDLPPSFSAEYVYTKF